jgi:hypothetical protein
VRSSPPLAAWALLTLAVLLAFDAGQIPTLLLTTNQSYGPSLGLFGAAIYLLRRALWIPRVAAVTVMILAAWTNGGVALFVAGVALMLVCVGATRDAAIPVFVGAIMSIVAHAGLQRVASGPLLEVTRIAIPAVDAVPSLEWAFWDDVVRLIGGAYWATMAVHGWSPGPSRLGAKRQDDLCCSCVESAGDASLRQRHGGSLRQRHGGLFYGLGRHIAPGDPAHHHVPADSARACSPGRC